jgi:hypothetical protein
MIQPIKTIETEMLLLPYAPQYVRFLGTYLIQ